ncbi:MAG TPA: chloride channel protein [Candidatus Dormibacteraeota bacterium]|nr:chloride channel protein [Candidatus Dormibacteraeota bacterium]
MAESANHVPSTAASGAARQLRESRLLAEAVLLGVIGALAYTLLASIAAYAVNGLFVSWQHLFAFPASSSGAYQPIACLWFGVLGVLAALVATLLPMVFYGLRDAFRELPIPSTWKPALGGLGVGLLAWKFPQILGGGLRERQRWDTSTWWPCSIPECHSNSPCVAN